MSITHAQTVVAAPDGVSEVQSDDWMAAHLISGMAGAPWTDWSPIFKAGANTATWTGTAKYLDLGAMVFWYFSVSFTSAVASGLVSVSNQPTALQGHDGSSSFGNGMWLDQGVNFYMMNVFIQSSTEWRFYRDAAGGNQFTNAIGNSPSDSATFWGVVSKSTIPLSIPTLGGGIGARAFHSTTQGSLAASTVNPLSLDSEESDTNLFHDPTTNNSRFTIPAGFTGKFAIVGKSKVNQSFQLYIRKNGTTLLRGGMTSAAGEMNEVVCLADLVGGTDYIELCEFHNSGTGIAGDASNDHLRTELSIVRIDSRADSGDAAWTNATMQNSWVEYDNTLTPAYRKLPNGMVAIRGAAKSGTVGSAMFTLPAGYRPSMPYYWAARHSTSAGAFTEVRINTDGTVVAQSGTTNTFVALSVSFFAG